MFRKLLFIALLCISVAQVHGGLLENAINNSLRRANIMNKKANNRLMEANRDVDAKKQFIFYKSTQFVEKTSRVQENSRQSLRNTAYAMERKAEENSRPESVFQCIRRNEQRANNEIETFVRKFATDMDRLQRTKLVDINTAAGAYMGLHDDLKVRYVRATTHVKRCQSIRCVNTVMGIYSSYLNSFYTKIRRVEGQTGTALDNFQRDANNYFANSNRPITKIRSAAVSDIRNCYYRGEREFLIPEDYQESQEV